MANGYYTANLDIAIKSYSVERVKDILSTFSCDLNSDIKIFLQERAVEFSSKGIAKTHLVLRGSEDDIELLGYYVLANKALTIPAGELSNSMKKRVERFGILDNRTNSYNVPVPLIAQLGKNYSTKLKRKLDGDELLLIACNKVAAIQNDLGGKFVYLECEDNPKLIDFYARNKFQRISDSKSGYPNTLIQMIKYL